MKVVGKTTAGVLVIAGIGEMYFQEGIPLSVIFDSVKDKNMIPAWPLLYEELKGNGMKHERIIHLLSEHIFESYGKEFRDIVIGRLNQPLPTI